MKRLLLVPLLFLAGCMTPVNHTIEKTDDAVKARIEQVSKETDKKLDDVRQEIRSSLSNIDVQRKDTLDKIDKQREETLTKINDISTRYEKIANDYKGVIESQSKEWQKFLKEEVPNIAKNSVAGAVEGLKPKMPDGSPNQESPWSTLIAAGISVAAAFATHKASDYMKNKNGSKRWTEEAISSKVKTEIAKAQESV